MLIICLCIYYVLCDMYISSRRSPSIFVFCYRRRVGSVFFLINFFFSPQDCNRDGVTDCDDYARIHFNGREDCSAIDNTNYWRRYETCRPVSNRGESTGRASSILYYIIIYSIYSLNFLSNGGHRAPCVCGSRVDGGTGLQVVGHTYVIIIIFGRFADEKFY